MSHSFMGDKAKQVTVIQNGKGVCWIHALISVFCHFCLLSMMDTCPVLGVSMPSGSSGHHPHDVTGTCSFLTTSYLSALLFPTSWAFFTVERPMSLCINIC